MNYTETQLEITKSFYFWKGFFIGITLGFLVVFAILAFSMMI